jgi:Family of unknown function (DUF5706)
VTRSRTTAPAPGTGITEVDHAWRILSFLLELIKHAETKAAATLAATGVLAGLLSAVAGRVTHPSPPMVATAAVAAAAIIVAGVSAGVALRPRAEATETSPGLIYYRGIAQRFPDDPADYARALAGLLADREALLTALSHQVWHSAHIADRKYRATGVAILALLVAVAAMTSTAMLVVLA